MILVRWAAVNNYMPIQSFPLISHKKQAQKTHLIFLTNTILCS